MVSFEVIHGDCLTLMAEMEAGSVDAVVTDPPYGINFMGKKWDAPGAFVERKAETGNTFDHVGGNHHACNPHDGARSTARANRRAQQWHEAWATEALRVLKPSHYLLAFGGTRTWHRLACALEDAGFEIRDTLMWLYGSGFPKGKACLKPAWEPIILARKPGPMRELGIEECRVGSEGGCFAVRKGGASVNALGDGLNGGCGKPVPGMGRWPANVILDEAAAGMVDGQSGDRPGSSSQRYLSPSKPGCFGVGDGSDTMPMRDGYNDSGGASRFYYCAKASRAERNAGLEGMPERYTARDNGYSDKLSDTKLPRANHHPTVKPLSLMRWLVRLVAREGDLVLDPFTGSGTTGVACVEEGRDFIGIERESEYVEIARRRIDAAAAQTRLPVGRNFVGVELNHEYARMAERRMAPHRDQMQLVTPCPRTGA